FEVRTVSDGDILSFAESNKGSSYGDVLLRTSTPRYITLDVYDTTYHLWDMLYVRFDPEATDKDDAHYDGRKPFGPAALNFYSWSADSIKMSLDTRPYNASKIIPLGIQSN